MYVHPFFTAHRLELDPRTDQVCELLHDLFQRSNISSHVHEGHWAGEVEFISSSYVAALSRKDGNHRHQNMIFINAGKLRILRCTEKSIVTCGLGWTYLSVGVRSS